MGAQANDSGWPTFSGKYARRVPPVSEGVVGIQAHVPWACKGRASVPQSQGEESGQRHQDPGKRHRGST
jgi:hypothetical protein